MTYYSSRFLFFNLTACKKDNPNHSLPFAESITIEVPSINSHKAMLHELFTDPSVMRQGASYNGFRESPSAIYYMYDNYLYHADASSSIFTILCGRPECQHIDEHCDAYIPYFDFTIFNGEIYTHSISTRDGVHYIKLWKRQLDGSVHEKVKDVYEIKEIEILKVETYRYSIVQDSIFEHNFYRHIVDCNKVAKPRFVYTSKT